MAKRKYTPFLKLKANEVGAFAVLSDELMDTIVPFFDLPIKKGITTDSFRQMVQKSARKVEKYFGQDRPFFLDDFDIPDSIASPGEPNYRYVMEQFNHLSFIPVVGLDRAPAHNELILQSKSSGLIKSDRVAIRLLEDDFQDFDLIKDDLRELMDSIEENFTACSLILDCRLCLNAPPAPMASALKAFIQAAHEAFEFDEIVVTGSSVPASIADVVKVERESDLVRVELQIFSILASGPVSDLIGLGDYTVVSPLYSELDLPPEMMQNVTAPKVLYTHDGVHYVSRGGALKSHARGNLQYNDIAKDITAKDFYRGEDYSFGDAFLAEKSRMVGKNVTPGSILKPTINAHITYMATDHPLVA